mmetsp:Transcript_3310/g.9402  ORF Transcript_3310/g.9402 Transcript_3310/m.9402 type:complete len:774 (+) Transcript_3310:3-2324(+)
MNACLPCMVSLGSRYEKSRRDAGAFDDEHKEDEENGSSSKVVIVDLRKSLNHQTLAHGNHPHGGDEASQSLYTAGTPIPGIEVMPREDASASNSRSQRGARKDAQSMHSASASVLSGAREMLTRVADSLIIPSYPTIENRSVGASAVPSVTSSTWTGSLLANGRPKRRRAQYSHKQEAERKAAVKEHRKLDAAPSVKESVMSAMNADEISFTEAVDYYAPGKYTLPKEKDVTEIDMCCGEHAWYKPQMVTAAFDRVVGIAEWDIETKKIVKLAIPYSLQAIIEGVGEIIEIALIGHYFGVNEANAVVIVGLFFSITEVLTYGFIEALGSLIPHAIGADNTKKAGNLITEATIWYILLSLPGIVLWFNVSEQAVLFFGFDDATARLAQRYVYVVGMESIVGGIDGSIYQVLDVIEKEKYSTWMTLIGNIMSNGMTLGLALWGLDDIITLAYYQFALTAVFLFVNAGIIAYTGWFSDFTKGIFSMPFMDWEQTKIILKTAIPLGVAYLLTYGEWEVTTIFASHLGSAEVAAWGLFGYVWTVLEYISDGVADASEVRCGIHLGADFPERARLCAYKCIFLGILTSLVATSLLFIIAEDAVKWITPDETLQRMMLEMMPLVGAGQIAMTTGVMSWAIIGAQGRYRLATTVQFFSSWGAAIPLSAVFTYVLNLNLQGLVGALTIGYTLAGTVNTYILMRSDWTKIAQIISERNADDDSSSSSSSSSSDDDNDNLSMSSASSSGKRSAVPGVATTPTTLLNRLESMESDDNDDPINASF